MFKKKYLLITLFLIIIFQTLLYTNNNEKTSFRYFKWNLQEVSIGKLISISFFSGFFISALLDISVSSYKKNTFEKFEDNYETPDNKENLKSNIEMPPQRDIRDAQPTISVNYRVIKNTEDKNIKRDQNYSNSSNYEDDWDENDDDW